jgi:hypothetical protein
MFELDSAETAGSKPYLASRSRPTTPGGVVRGSEDKQGLLPTHTLPRKRSIRTTCLDWRAWLAYLPNTTWTRLFTLTLLVQAIVEIILAAIPMVAVEESLLQSDHVEKTGATRVLPAQFATIAFECLWQIILSLEACHRRNLVQTIGICFNNAVIFMMILIGWFTVDTNITMVSEVEQSTKFEGFLYAFMIIPAVFTVALGLIVWKLSVEFEWHVNYFEVLGPTRKADTALVGRSSDTFRLQICA